jgi:hypothetical protein
MKIDKHREMNNIFASCDASSFLKRLLGGGNLAKESLVGRFRLSANS